MTRPTGYLGNQLLKKIGVKHNWTQHEISEYIKCSQDPIYFTETYSKIVHVDKGLISFKLYPFQKKVIETIHNNRFSIFKFGRQSGKSTSIVCGYFLWYILFNKEKTVGILANKGDTAMEILGRLQKAYENLPKFLQQGVREYNKGSFELENGCRVIAGATSSNSVRGFSYSMILLDEAAHIPTNTWNEFYTSVYPTISSGTQSKIVMVSTPNGLNHFYKIWMDSKEGRNSYVNLEADWTAVPWRDEKWKQQEIEMLGSYEKFKQEHETEFIGSSNTLLNSNCLRNLVFKDPIYRKDNLDIYEKPIQGNTYFIVADIAEGINLDYSAFCVFDISQIPYKMVAKYRNNKISELLYPNVINKVSKEYNNAYILVEINKGLAVANILHNDLENENLVFCSLNGRRGQVLGGFGVNTYMGVKTTPQTKRIGCNNAKDLIENGKLMIEDYETINEFSTFVSDESGKYAADEGCHDDLVMCCVLFGWAADQDYFRELSNSDLRMHLHKKRIEQIEEDLIPFGFINDGKDNYDYTL